MIPLDDDDGNGCGCFQPLFIIQIQMMDFVMLLLWMVGSDVGSVFDPMSCVCLGRNDDPSNTWNYNFKSVHRIETFFAFFEIRITF